VKRHLIFKLLAINLLVIGFVMVIVWVSIDTLAAGYFVTLMEDYNISPRPAHSMFVSAVHRYLIWASLGAVFLAIVLSYALTRRALAPLIRMTHISKDIAEGNFSVTVPVINEDEVGQLARSFNQMAYSLKEMENLRRALVIDVAHELRTPLTNMRGYLEALCDEVLPPSQNTFSLLQDETLRLGTLVEDVLNLARADSAGRNLHLVPTDLRKMITDVLEAYSLKLTEKSIIVSVFPALPVSADGDNPDDGATVSADPDKLIRIIRNLTDNAATYAPENGEIEIRLETGTDTVSVAYVNDAGEVRPDDLPYLFERFYRSEKSRSRLHGGAGIGLAIVKELVKAHGGTVDAGLQNGKISIGFTLPKQSS
jgi:two-component system sensor histidine kinase BaeS